MPLTEGAGFGPYQVVALLGVGGMGEVYRARDTTLNRDVALKVLPDLFATDAERLARFTREAQVLASLSHPNIGAIFGVEQGALVLELVEGPTLADRLAHGAIAIDEALSIARQIADALEAAHDRGIIHRDLKPANIKLRPDGAVKVLDFGLAAVVQGPDSRQSSATMSPTLTIAATQAGLIMGTAAYMSPEQAAAKVVDKRTDVWSFGVVLWEMLTGRRLFEGETISHTLADVLRAPIDFNALPRETPRAIRDLVERCLDRTAKTRLRDIGEARVAIDRAVKEIEAGPPASVSSLPSRWTRAVPWSVAALVLAGAVALLVTLVPWGAKSASLVRRFSVDLGPDVLLLQTGGSSVALSADGQMFAYTPQSYGGARGIFVRRLDELEARPLSETTGAVAPFFSPDGKWIGFFIRGSLRKTSVLGGAAVTLAEATSPRGGSWSDDGTIVFAGRSEGPLMRIPADSGTPQPFTQLAQGEVTHRWPQVLPGGKVVVYTAHSSIINFEDANIVVQPLPRGQPKIVQRGGYYGRYLPSGHLIYVHGGTLFAAPFDLGRLEVTGPSVPVISGLLASNNIGVGYFDVSNEGTLVYEPAASGSDQVPIDWLDKSGTVVPLRAMPADWTNLAFSPDGQRLAFDVASGNQQTDVWTYDLSREVLTPLTRDGVSQKPVWTPDGHRIVFGSRRDGPMNLYWQSADGTGDIQRLTNGPSAQGATSWDPTGKVLAYHELNAQTRDDVWMLPIEGDDRSGWKPGRPSMFLGGPSAQRGAMFSPDGRWLAYQGNEGGGDEVYVVSYPGGTNRIKISGTGGGVDPTWSRTRPELFYATVDQHIMVVRYQVKGDTFVPEKAELWSDARFVSRYRVGPTRSFDLHRDGDRFALAVASNTAIAKERSVVFELNFFDELRRIAPPK